VTGIISQLMVTYLPAIPGWLAMRDLVGQPVSEKLTLLAFNVVAMGCGRGVVPECRWHRSRGSRSSLVRSL
jgi:hypothetical protein